MTRLDTPKESDLKSTIYQYLTVCESMGKLWFERLNSGELLVLNKDQSKRLVKLCREGTSDFIVVAFGRPIFIECKKIGGKQSESQKEFQQKVESVGAIYWLVDNFEQFLNLMQEVK